MYIRSALDRMLVGVVGMQVINTAGIVDLFVTVNYTNLCFGTRLAVTTNSEKCSEKVKEDNLRKPKIFFNYSYNNNI